MELDHYIHLTKQQLYQPLGYTTKSVRNPDSARKNAILSGHPEGVGCGDLGISERVLIEKGLVFLQ